MKTLLPSDLQEVDRNLAIVNAAVNLATNWPVGDPLLSKGNVPTREAIMRIGHCALIRANDKMRGMPEGSLELASDAIAAAISDSVAQK